MSKVARYTPRSSPSSAKLGQTLAGDHEQTAEGGDDKKPLRDRAGTATPPAIGTQYKPTATVPGRRSVVLQVELNSPNWTADVDAGGRAPTPVRAPRRHGDAESHQGAAQPTGQQTRSPAGSMRPATVGRVATVRVRVDGVVDEIGPGGHHAEGREGSEGPQRGVRGSNACRAGRREDQDTFSDHP